ncbi:hypothetical protein [Fulvivirga sedimenti]|jgi:hypothetical protein|uniref:SPOR domain-containing protein n=1 Tax=Fulvivirga sedimenti TaxID=2879465 RepID=A0A9X1HQB5_9BACT|nr:hypothetical protein [Fulvivirga sedimenti]MCA6074369.1 hypothetical protein [Fulvivirga sedimenti]
MRIQFILWLSALVALASCASLSTSKPSDDEVYREDLAVHRPTYEVPADTVGSERVIQADYGAITPSNDITDQLDAVLESSDQYKAETKFVDGYTIQIYTGSSSDEARIIRGKAISLLPDQEVELFYDEPSFKVKVGQYFSRLEAQHDYANLKGKFPTAIIIPDKIPIP